MTQIALGYEKKVVFEGDFRRCDTLEYVRCMFILQVHKVDDCVLYSAWCQPKNLLHFGWIDTTLPGSQPSEGDGSGR